MLDKIKYLLDEETGFQVLDELMSDPSVWNSLNITYHPPRVERVWRQHGDNRIFLHRIHPCEPGEALWHSHDWPSAMAVVKGRYEHKVGYLPYRGAEATVEDLLTKIRCLTTLVLPEGSLYEMTEPKAFHSVRPLDGPALSLMVTGKPWDQSDRFYFPKPKVQQEPLPPEVVEEILTLFANSL